MAYLITCSGSKNVPEIFNPGLPEHLSYHDILGGARQELINLTGIQVNWNYTLPAWRLYSGNRSRLYRRVNDVNWNKPCVEIKILSALFGWIKHTDLLPYYDLKMTAQFQNQSIWSIWFNMNVLEEVVTPEDVDLLSLLYRRAVHGNPNPVAIDPGIIFNGYGDQKGIWLNNQLTPLLCQ